MPLSSAQSRTQLINRGENFSGTVGGLGNTVQLNITFNRAFVPEDLWDALISLYGSGKIICDKDTMSHSNWDLRVLP